jgi:hypothetical protein
MNFIQKRRMNMEKEKVESKEERHYRPYRRDPDDPNHLIFPSKPYSLHRDMGPEPAPPEGIKDQLRFDKLPLDKVMTLLQEYPEMKKNADGVRFPGGHIRVKLQNGSILEGWLNAVDLQKFQREGLVRGWRAKLR